MGILKRKIKHFIIMLFAPLLMLLCVIAAVASDEQTTQALTLGKMKQQEEQKNESPVLLGLTDFTYFLVYESGSALYKTVLGDGGNAFGAYQFDYRYALQPFLDDCVRLDPIKYGAFTRFTSKNISDKKELKGNQGLANAWEEVYIADPTGFSKRQDDFIYKNSYLPMEAYQKAHGIDLSKRPKVIQGLCLSIHNRKGCETSSYSYIQSSGVNDSMSDEEFVKKLCDAFGKRGGFIYERYCVDYSSGACGLLCEKNMVLSILKNGGISAMGKSYGNVPYFYQGDYGNVPFDRGTVADSGCGVTSFAMVASAYLGRTVSVPEVASWAMANHANTVTNWGAFATLAAHYGFSVSRQAAGPLYKGSSQPIKDALKAGKLVIGSHTGGTFNPSGRGHYIVYAGMIEGKILINDPGSVERTEQGYAQNGWDENTAFSHCKQYWVFERV